MTNTKLKKRIQEQRYFYLEGNEFHGDYGTKKNRKSVV